MGNPMTLEFNHPELIAMIAASVIAALVAIDGRSNWLEGAMLLVVYAMLALGFYLPADDDLTPVTRRESSNIVGTGLRPVPTTAISREVSQPSQASRPPLADPVCRTPLQTSHRWQQGAFSPRQSDLAPATAGSS